MIISLLNPTFNDGIRFEAQANWNFYLLSYRDRANATDEISNHLCFFHEENELY